MRQGYRSKGTAVVIQETREAEERARKLLLIESIDAKTAEYASLVAAEYQQLREQIAEKVAVTDVGKCVELGGVVYALRRTETHPLRNLWKPHYLGSAPEHLEQAVLHYYDRFSVQEVESLLKLSAYVKAWVLLLTQKGFHAGGYASAGTHWEKDVHLKIYFDCR